MNRKVELEGCESNDDEKSETDAPTGSMANISLELQIMKKL